jgi:hypothetical protein
MKLKYKKYVYLLNDITNQLLKKDREDMAKHIERLQYWIIGLSVALVLSLLANVLFLWLY